LLDIYYNNNPHLIQITYLFYKDFSAASITLQNATARAYLFQYSGEMC
jgi:hypothetical protein